MKRTLKGVREEMLAGHIKRKRVKGQTLREEEDYGNVAKLQSGRTSKT